MSSRIRAGFAAEVSASSKIPSPLCNPNTRLQVFSLAVPQLPHHPSLLKHTHLHSHTVFITPLPACSPCPVLGAARAPPPQPPYHHLPRSPTPPGPPIIVPFVHAVLFALHCPTSWDFFLAVISSFHIKSLPYVPHAPTPYIIQLMFKATTLFFRSRGHWLPTIATRRTG